MHGWLSVKSVTVPNGLEVAFPRQLTYCCPVFVFSDLNCVHSNLKSG